MAMAGTAAFSLISSFMHPVRTFAPAAFLLAANVVPAVAQVPGPPVSAEARSAVSSRFPEIRPEQLSPAPVPGLLEVRIGSKVAYVSADGRYLIQGEIIDLDTEVNLTEQRRGTARRDALSEVSEASMVVFAPKGTSKHTVTVFTDIDCGYCRKLHRQIADYNARGIKVRYLAFPRSGPGTESWRKAELVWCSKDRQGALTRSKAGEVLKGNACQPNPVAAHYQLGRDFGIQGTPAIVLESGEVIGGYLEPAELAKYLDESKAKTPARVGQR
jgi:thiol:disulfide interchange protein DsbC